MSLNRYYAVHIDKEKISYIIIHDDGIKVAPILQKRLIIRNRETLSPKNADLSKVCIVLGNRYGISGSLLNSDLFCSTNVVFHSLAHVHDHSSVVGHGFCTVSPL